MSALIKDNLYIEIISILLKCGLYRIVQKMFYALAKVKLNYYIFLSTYYKKWTG